jgi:hypothetical protein
LIAVLFMIGWLATRDLRETPAAARSRALAVQARRFERFGYEDVRVLEGKEHPIPLTDIRGRTSFPDLSAIRKDRRLLVLAWVPCRRIGKQEELDRLRLLSASAGQRQAELQLLTETVCGEDAGPDRLRAWLQGSLPDTRIWTP